MRKEVIIAIVLGFGLGLIITFGIWSANRSLQEKPIPTVILVATPTPQNTPTPTPPALTLEISYPEENSIIKEEEINLRGTTLPEAIVVIFYEDGERILEANQDGNFETTITLNGGANEIIVKAFDQKGNEVEKTINVVYSTAEI
ncbi:MAG TPA: hypothetical protein VMW41_03535 [Candidatus Bathyarchaeia archaeon]|nr:hypothetical protein [Candidatus Bathyarchaeia archaeon]